MLEAGGPAFPLENPRHLENGELFKQFVGMTLRDYFAAAAIQGVGTWMPDGGAFLNSPRSHAGRAKWAYEQADAMLEARK